MLKKKIIKQKKKNPPTLSELDRVTVEGPKM